MTKSTTKPKLNNDLPNKVIKNNNKTEGETTTGKLKYLLQDEDTDELLRNSEDRGLQQRQYQHQHLQQHRQSTCKDENGNYRHLHYPFLNQNHAKNIKGRLEQGIVSQLQQQEHPSQIRIVNSSSFQQKQLPHDNCSQLRKEVKYNDDDDDANDDDDDVDNETKKPTVLYLQTTSIRKQQKHQRKLQQEQQLQQQQQHSLPPPTRETNSDGSSVSSSSSSNTSDVVQKHVDVTTSISNEMQQPTLLSSNTGIAVQDLPSATATAAAPPLPPQSNAFTGTSLLLQQIPQFLHTSPLNSMVQQLVMSVTTTTQATAAKEVSLQQQQNSLPKSTLGLQQHVPDRDYDDSPTELYKLIEQKKWSTILQRFDDIDDDDDDVNEYPNGNNNNYCTIQQQASLWIVRKELNGRLKWRILPIHAAIIFRAPYNVIEAILQIDSKCISQKDDQGMLPLHLIMKNLSLQYNQHYYDSNNIHKGNDTGNNTRSLSLHHRSSNLHNSTTTQEEQQQMLDDVLNIFRIIEELITIYPAGLYARDRKGRTPLQLGIKALRKVHITVISSTKNNQSNHEMNMFQRQLQSMIQTILSLLQLFEKIYSNSNNNLTACNTNNTSNSTIPQSSVLVSKPQRRQSSENAPTLKRADVATKVPLSSPELRQRQHHPPTYDTTFNAASEMNNDVVAVQQRYIQTLMDLRELFQQQQNDMRRKCNEEYVLLKQKLDNSVYEQQQMQIEIDELRNRLKQQEQQLQSLQIE